MTDTLSASQCPDTSSAVLESDSTRGQMPFAALPSRLGVERLDPERVLLTEADKVSCWKSSP